MTVAFHPKSALNQPMAAPVKIPSQRPFLTAVCWQLHDIRHLSPKEMLQRYERGWHYRSVFGKLDPQAQAFVEALARQYGSWLSHRVSFKQHQKILEILAQLDAEFLEGCQAYFGGGTLLALAYAEYRLSQDIGFLCASSEGYRHLRRTLFDRQYRALFQTTTGIAFPREIQANQYGVRFPIIVDDLTIRLEIVLEGRIDFGPPERLHSCPVVCLHVLDRATEKLLANNDRGADTSVMSRDLIDLAMMCLRGDLPAAAFRNAEAAYPVIAPLQRAIEQFQQRPDYRDRCYDALPVAQPVAQPDWIADSLDRLAADFGLKPTERSLRETSARKS